MRVNKARLAELIGLAPLTIDRSFERGAPYIAKGAKKAGWEIDPAAWCGWYFKWKIHEAADDVGGVNLTTAQTRRARADAKRLEDQNTRKQGLTTTLDEVLQRPRDWTRPPNSLFYAIPSRLAVAVSGETAPAAIAQWVRAELATIFDETIEGVEGHDHDSEE